MTYDRRRNYWQEECDDEEDWKNKVKEGRVTFPDE
jgi:hypothetical protein